MKKYEYQVKELHIARWALFTSSIIDIEMKELITKYASDGWILQEVTAFQRFGYTRKYHFIFKRKIESNQ